MTKSKYLYASGLLRSLENKILDSNDTERMIGAANLTEAFNVFNDTDYANNLLGVEARDFNKALEDDLMQLKNLFFQIIPDENLLKIIFYYYDFHNIKLAFKEKYLEKNLEKHSSSLGFSNYQKIKNVIVNEKKEDLPKEINKAIDCINEQLGKEKPLSHLIDRWTNWQYFKVIYGLAQKINNSFLKKLVSLQIDIANLKSFIRGKRMNRESNYIISEILLKGSIPIKDFTELMEKPLEEGLNYFKKYFSKKAARLIEDYLEHKNLWRLERDLENLELDFVRQSKFVAYGPEIALGYYYAKKNATRNVRLIMTAKLNNIKSEEIKERRRELF